MWMLLLLACDSADDTDTDPVDTDSDVETDTDVGPEPIPAVWRDGIKPLFEDRCRPCHTGYAFGDLDVRQRSNLVDVPSSIGMPHITPGSLEDSYVWRKIEDTHHDVGGTGELMPLDSLPFQEHELDALSQWILDGAPVNAD